jgi:hypothetical protein
MIVDSNIAIPVRSFYPLQGQFRSAWIAPMNVLPRDKQIEAVAALTEGCSIRAIERLTRIHRDTIMRLGVRVGNGCGTLHDATWIGPASDHAARLRAINAACGQISRLWSTIQPRSSILVP